MPIVYRRARQEDLALSDELVVKSINDLTERHGFGPMAQPSPPNFQTFCLDQGRDGLWVAEDDGLMLGFAFSWVCDDFWFLAQLFVSPERQGAGIGNALIGHTLAQAEKSGAAKRALITFTFNRVSQGLYIRHGLYPRFPIYFFSIERERLRPQSGAVLNVSVAEDRESFAVFDHAALGVSRAAHHGYLAGEPGTRALLLSDGSVPAGYVYVSRSGHIGPLAVLRPEFIEPAFRTALQFAAAGTSSNVSAFLPGSAERTLRLAVEQGMRITFPMVLMATRQVADWTQYLPRNPGFM